MIEQGLFLAGWMIAFISVLVTLDVLAYLFKWK